MVENCSKAHVAVKTYIETLRWKVPSAILTRHCPFRLLLVPIDGRWPVCHFTNLSKFVDSVKRRSLYPTRYCFADRKRKK